VTVDSSAVLAILLSEPEADQFTEEILACESCAISAVSFVEASIIAESNSGDGSVRQVDALLRKTGITIDPVTEELTMTARQAYSDYGKGHQAADLSLRDCFSYALAKISSQPLLFKGNGFSRTDV
jgi:ribonuclease VapC